jgi:hypothetical protein
MLGRLIVAGWIFIFGCVLLLGLFPRLLALIPHPEYIRVFLIVFVPVSAVYGVVWLYKEGMKRTGGK